MLYRSVSTHVKGRSLPPFEKPVPLKPYTAYTFDGQDGQSQLLIATTEWKDARVSFSVGYSTDYDL